MAVTILLHGGWFAGDHPWLQPRLKTGNFRRIVCILLDKTPCCGVACVPGDGGFSSSALCLEGATVSGKTHTCYTKNGPCTRLLPCRLCGARPSAEKIGSSNAIVAVATLIDGVLDGGGHFDVPAPAIGPVEWVHEDHAARLPPSWLVGKAGAAAVHCPPQCCVLCHETNAYAVPNLPDGRFACYPCRTYRAYQL